MSKKVWGNATWYLFHTLAEKLRPEHSREAPRLLSLMINLCSYLPCDDCSTHARNNLKRANTRKVRDKESLKKFLWEFHNVVNRQLRKREFSYAECTNKYKQARTNNIIVYFNRSFINATRTNKLVLGAHTRDQTKASFMNYIHRNIYKFYP